MYNKSPLAVGQQVSINQEVSRGMHLTVSSTMLNLSGKQIDSTELNREPLHTWYENGSDLFHHKNVI